MKQRFAALVLLSPLLGSAGCGGAASQAEGPAGSAGPAAPTAEPLVLQITCPAGQRLEGNACVAAAAPTEECIAGTTPDGASCGAELPPAGEERPLKIVRESSYTPRAGTLEEIGLALRDSRRLRHEPLSRSTLVTELSASERRFRSTAVSSPARRELLRYLALRYTELAAVAAQDRAQALATGQSQQAKRSLKIEKAAREKAIKYYRRLSKEHPQWCAGPAAGTGCRDEWLYFLGYEYELAGDLGQARKCYLELATQFKRSRYLPLVYLAFGELFRAEGRSDPSKLPIAEQFYREVRKYPPPDNQAYGYATFCLAEVQALSGDSRGAQASLLEVLSFGRDHPGVGYSQLLAHLADAKLKTLP